MSVYSAVTCRTSILKTYSPAEREKTKNSILNKVRFEVPKLKGLKSVVAAVCEEENYTPLCEFVAYLGEMDLHDTEFCCIINDARKIVHKLSSKCTKLVEMLLSLSWIDRDSNCVQAYGEFFIDLMVAHNTYIQFGISKLIALWISNDELMWMNGLPLKEKREKLQIIHKLLERLLIVIPMSCDVVLHTIETMFPYYKKPSHIIAGYVHNLLWLMQYKPMFMDFLIQLIFRKMTIMDVNAPRNEIEDTEYDEEEEGEQNEMNGEEEREEVCKTEEHSIEVSPMQHPIAHSLDICMEKMFALFDTWNVNVLNLSEADLQLQRRNSIQLFKTVMLAFDKVILPSHNTNHIQFLLFYYCSFKQSLAEDFLISLWSKIKNPNTSAVIRQAAVSYLASFLARSKFLLFTTLTHYLKELCDWAHSYIQRTDQYRSNNSVKANLVFYSICQAIFYVISFRSRNLTAKKKRLLFLQSLHLPALVNCSLNPLRVCLPAVATAFAGVTRAYQLAYCHAILERNARRKLATVYSNGTLTPEETLDTFFPFDPYLLKFTAKRISPHYLHYQASEAEELSDHNTATTATTTTPVGRKRGDSEMIDDTEVDDFLLAEKRHK